MFTRARFAFLWAVLPIVAIFEVPSWRPCGNAIWRNFCEIIIILLYLFDFRFRFQINLKNTPISRKKKYVWRLKAAFLGSYMAIFQNQNNWQHGGSSVYSRLLCVVVWRKERGTRVEERSCFSYRKNLTKKDLPLKHQQQQYHRHHQHRQARPTFFGEFSSSQRPHHIRSYLVVCANKYFLYIVARKESAHAFLVD